MLDTRSVPVVVEVLLDELSVEEGGAGGGPCALLEELLGASSSAVFRSLSIVLYSDSASVRSPDFKSLESVEKSVTSVPTGSLPPVSVV